jgi:hypothetical protein
MKYLFLDIDGVLNCHESDPEVLCGQIHKDKVALLNDVLRATEARVVLSSAWRYIVHRGEATLAGMDWLLRSHGVLAGRLVGITREDTMVRPAVYDGRRESWPVVDERGQQITDWLALNRVGYEGHAVVDDLDLGISAAGHPFVDTDGTVGLTRWEADALIRLLGETA